MPRELLILRHGKSDWNQDVSDFHRPLKDRGKRGAQRIGVWLLQKALIPDHVISSPAERALTTAQKCIKAMGLGTERIQSDDRIYEGGLGSLRDTLADCPKSAQRVLLVGHNPGLEDLLLHLTGGKVEVEDDGKLLPTATLVRLRMPKDWTKLDTGCAKQLNLKRPASLPKRFPFPKPGSKDLRERPAYYYTQSSVIPYRIHRGDPEILLISSSKQKHWVVPKGIQEPGLTPQQSAAKEAWEEAGVEGNVGKKPIGHYVYEKWGAQCTVSVYPMEVTRMVPEAKWKERHRGREWVSPMQASKRLKQEELRPMVLALASRLIGD